MANSVKKHGFHLPFEMTRRRMILIALTVTVLVTLTIAVPLLIKRYREEMWEYSGAKTDRSVQLLYDMDHMGDFSVVSDKLQADGRYSEHIVVEKAIDVRLWRNFERPKLPCREQIMEKYPDLSGYSQQKAPEDALYCQRGKTGTARHTATPLSCCVEADGITWLIYRSGMKAGICIRIKSTKS